MRTRIRVRRQRRTSADVKQAEAALRSLFKRKDTPREPTVSRDDRRMGRVKLYEEQQVARTEIVMLHGERDAGVIARRLKISPKAAFNYVERVLARWEIVGSERNIRRMRGEALQRLDAMEREVWEQYGDLGRRGFGGKVACLNIALKIHELRNQMNGLTAEAIDAMPDHPNENSSIVQARMEKQERLAKLGRTVLRILSEETAAGPLIDVTPTVSS